MIFISYRRKEGQNHARSMFERLRHDFPDQVFMDVNDIKPGENFHTRIGAQLQGCRVLLALIGPDWQGATDRHGRVRLQDKRDWVRFEIATALQRGITVIPVLIDGASMPEEEALPEDLHPLLDLHALSLDLDRHFEHGMVDLVSVMREVLAEPAPDQQQIGVMPALPVPTFVKPDWAVRAGPKDEFETPWADIEIGGVVQRMRWIAPGSFLMGCDQRDSGGFDDEKPQHRVTLTKGFWLADTACTQGLWQAVTGQNPSDFKDSVDLPVDSVSWDDVTGLFLPKLRQRLGVSAELPTEAEWEFACRAGTQTPYWFGQNISEKQANFGNSVGQAVPVKDRPANGWGLYQMHGNVGEWCAGSRRQYGAAVVENPPDGQDQNSRALRGGSLLSEAWGPRSAFRDGRPRDHRSQFIGFRFSLRSIKPSR